MQVQRSFVSRVFGYLTRHARRIARISWQEQVVSIRNLLGFLHSARNDREVLVVEPNEFHAEILPGFCKYLTDLGYKVTLILRHANYASKVFARVPKEAQPEFLCMAPWAMKVTLRRLNSGSCPLIFFSSSYFVQEGGFFGLFVDYLGFIPRGRLGYFMVEHHFPVLIPELEKGRIDSRRVFLLSRHQHGECRVPMLNPHYFGFVRHDRKSRKTRFVTVGSLSIRNRNPMQLVAAVNELLSRGVFDFEVIVIGRDTSALAPGLIPGNIRVLGALDYDLLYNEVEAADFFLPLLDPDNEGHRRYLRGETTGSRQLILGFTKIPVIHEEFARTYGFTEADSVLHATGCMAKAMERAILMSGEDYETRQLSLREHAGVVYRESLENLRAAIEAVSRN